MIRILQVMGGMNRRGAETFIMNVYRKIDKSKVQFDFLVYNYEKQDYEDEIQSLGGRVLHIDCKVGYKAIFSITKIRKVIKDNGPYKAVHIQTLLNSVWVLIAMFGLPNIKRIVHSHNTHNTVCQGFISMIYEQFAKYLIRNMAQIKLACGEEAGNYLFGKSFEKNGVINNGIDLDIHTHKNKEAIQSIISKFDLSNRLVIGSVARFNEVKNHKFMIQIADCLKKQAVDFKMLFIGNGNDNEESALRKQVSLLNLEKEIIFVGLRNDITDFMFTFDVFLMPSFFEGNPVTLIEAQAAGLPCVISDCITDKMDMGLNLIYKCSLNESPKCWANKIVEASKMRCTDLDRIKNQISLNQYDVNLTSKYLLNLYSE